MRLGLIFSILLHATLLAFAVIVIERSMPFVPEQADIPAEVVTVADFDKVIAATKETKPKEDLPAPAPEVAPPPAEAAPPEPEPEPEAAPPEPAPEPKVEPPKPPKDAVKPQQRPTPKKADKDKEDKFDLDAISVLINKEQKAQEKQQKTAEAKPGETADTPRESVGTGDDMTMTISSALQRQVEACWTFPAGAANPEQLIVQVDINLSADGSLSGSPEIVDQSRMGEPFFKAAAEAALRAVYRCQPFDLPAENYDTWGKETYRLSFDPRKAVGMGG